MLAALKGGRECSRSFIKPTAHDSELRFKGLREYTLAPVALILRLSKACACKLSCDRIQLNVRFADTTIVSSPRGRLRINEVSSYGRARTVLNTSRAAFYYVSTHKRAFLLHDLGNSPPRYQTCRKALGCTCHKLRADKRFLELPNVISKHFEDRSINTMPRVVSIIRCSFNISSVSLLYIPHNENL